MPYKDRVHTVVETPEYLAAAKRAGMSDTEREYVVETIARVPDAGVIIPGTGGARKIRVPKGGRGKSAGYRVVTYYTDAEQPVFLLTVISKGQRANLTQG
jgi:mRNA-degrading endonuclease RelE of RelBE toxin-antitoxin system